MFRACTVLFAALASTAAGAAQIQPLESLRHTVGAFLAEQHAEAEGTARVEVGHIDARLRLAACAEPLEAFFPPGGRRLGNLSVGVRCAASKPWTVYVTATVQMRREVVVLARPVPRGSELGAADLRLEVHDTSRLLSGYFTDPADLRGMRAGQALSAGQVLNPGLVSAPQLVRRGQRVTLLARVGGIEVRSAGSALADGAAGDLVQVKNLRSQRVVEGIVAGEGLIRVAM